MCSQTYISCLSKLEMLIGMLRQKYYNPVKYIGIYSQSGLVLYFLTK